MSDQNERELEEFGRQLARLRAVSAPAALRRDVRGALLAAPVTFAAPRPGTAWLMRLRPALAIVFVLAILAGGAGTAAAGSLPGDAAFGLKRAVEDAQVAISRDDTTRLDLLVAQTDRRLSELETIASRGAGEVAAATDEYVAALGRLERMLAAVAAQPVTQARNAAMERARDAAAAHVARLESLAGTLPRAAQQGIQRAIEAGQGIRDDRTGRPSKSPEPARPSDAPAGATSVPGHNGEVPSRPPTPTHR